MNGEVKEEEKIPQGRREEEEGEDEGEGASSSERGTSSNKDSCKDEKRAQKDKKAPSPRNPQSRKEFKEILSPRKFLSPTGKYFATPGCDEADPCCKRTIKHTDPEYLKSPPTQADCNGVKQPIQSMEEAARKRAFMKDVLLNPENHPVPPESLLDKKNPLFDDNPQTTESLEFLKSKPDHYGVAGNSDIKLGPEELRKAMNGLTNMHLAHEICVNNEFRFEALHAPGNSLEETIKEQMKKAYWDLFDQSLTAKDNSAFAMGVFREMKQMLLDLLLPHNRQTRQKIEQILDETQLQHEIDHEILEIPKYTNFIIEILGQLCCPARDKQIEDLKKLEKPSEICKSIMTTMENMHLDLANFMISQIRPAIVDNCVTYERKKFSEYIEAHYRLNADPLRTTRAWLKRHVIPDRSPQMTIAKGFAEIFQWEIPEIPETLILDWNRLLEFAREADRISFLGAAVLNGFNTARNIFGEGEDVEKQTEYINPYLLRCYPMRDGLKNALAKIITKDDCVGVENISKVMDLLAEEAAKVCGKYVHKLMKRKITAEEKEMVRNAVKDCKKPHHPVRQLLIRRMQDYVCLIITTGKIKEIAFPQALRILHQEVTTLVVDLSRIATHNRLVFQDLYFGIIDDEIREPKFMDQLGGQYDPSIEKAFLCLTEKPEEQIVNRKPGAGNATCDSKDGRSRLPFPNGEEIYSSEDEGEE